MHERAVPLVNSGALGFGICTRGAAQSGSEESHVRHSQMLWLHDNETARARVVRQMQWPAIGPGAQPKDTLAAFSLKMPLRPVSRQQEGLGGARPIGLRSVEVEINPSLHRRTADQISDRVGGCRCGSDDKEQ